MKNEILELYHQHSFTGFSKHNELLGLVVCAESFYGEDVNQEFNEVVFAVEKNWLISYLKMQRGWRQWSGEIVKQWLREEYTSDDSYEIFYAALEDNAIVMLEFN